MAIKDLHQRYPGASRGIVLVLLIAGCIANFFLFPKLIATPYITFYSKAGAGVSLGMLLLELSWKDIDKNSGITSRDPLVYIGSTLQLIGLPLIVLGVHLQRKFNSNRVSPLDLLFSLPFILLVLSGLAIWLVTIAPAQYFVNYVCSAPSKLINSSSAKVYARLREGWELEVRPHEPGDPKPEDLPASWWDASMQGQARKLTSAYSAIFLTALAWVLS